MAFSKVFLINSFLITIILLITIADNNKKYNVEARYLPTRSNGDRIDKLRELLKDLLVSELEKEDPSSETIRYRPENKLFFKRELPRETTTSKPNEK